MPEPMTSLQHFEDAILKSEKRTASTIRAIYRLSRENKRDFEVAVKDLKSDNRNTRITVIATAVSSVLALAGLTYTFFGEQGNWTRQNMDRQDARQERIESTFQSIQEQIRQIQQQLNQMQQSQRSMQLNKG